MDMSTKTIAIDFDNTWTVDPILWALFSEGAKSRGHLVIICTSRGDCEENRAEFHKSGVPAWMMIIFADEEPKRDVCKSAGVPVDIWIDDSPYFITHGVE